MVVVTRAGRLREWSKGELRLYHCFLLRLEKKKKLARGERWWQEGKEERKLQWRRDPLEGGTPLYKLYRNVPPHRVGFLRRFGLETGIHFAHFGLESGMVFGGTTGVYERIDRFNSK